MKQVIVGRTPNFLAGSGTEYAPLMGYGGSTLEATAIQVIPASGTLSDLRVKLGTAPGAGKQWTVSVNVNGTPSLDVVISGTDTTGVSTGSVSVSPGDLVTVKCVPGSSPANTIVYHSCVFEGTTAGQSILLGNTSSQASTTDTRYGPVSTLGNTATEADMKQIIPTPGTIKNLYVWLDADPGTSPDAYRATLRKSGASSALTCTIVADATTGNDTDAGHAVSVSAGDDVTIMIEPVDTPVVASRVAWGMVFVADTDGESLILGGSNSDLVNFAARQIELPMQGSTWSFGAGTFVMGACTIRKFYVELSGSPRQNSDTDDWYQFDVRLDASNTGIVATVVDGGTGNMVANDTTNSAAVTDGQVIDLKSTPNSSPTVRDAYWGLVCYIEPEAAGSTYDEALTLAVSGGMNRSTILSAINSATLALSAGLVRSNLAEMNEGVSFGLTADILRSNALMAMEACAFGVAVAKAVAGGADFNEAVILAVNAIEAQTTTVEMNAGLSLGISAEQGTGSTAEMDAVLALSLAMAMLQAGDVTTGAQTYEEAATLAAAMGMSHTAIGNLQEAVTLATAIGQGQTGQSVMVNALVLQATASMIQASVGSLSASLNLDVSMGEAFGTALILQASVLLGAAGGLSASGGMSLEDAATLGINAGMAQTVGYLLTAAMELSVQASQAQSAAMTAEARVALNIACSKIDSMGQDVNVSLSLSIVADMAQWGIVPRIAAARHLYNALARKREYDAKERKREYDATARKREYDEE